LEVNGHLGDSLTGIRQNEDSWEKSLQIFCKISNRFNFQRLLPADEIAAFLPKEPLIDSASLSYARQLDLGYLEYQRMRPLDGPHVTHLFPFRDPKWAGFWLNRTPAETSGQSLWLRFLKSLHAKEFMELKDGFGRTRAGVLTKMAAFLYGTSHSEGKIDLKQAGKVLPSNRSIHFCLFACHANNPHFRRTVDQSLARLKRRELFQPAFIDAVFRHFASREINSDNMLNGLVALDVMTEAGRFD
jgi:hypothetical protein